MFTLSRKTVIGIISAVFAIVVLSMLGRIGEDVKNETIVVNQFPFSGTMEYWTSPGYHWQWFGKTTVYHKTEQLWFGSTDDENNVQGTPIPVIFNDASDGLIYGSLRVKLPTDELHLSRIQTDYNGMYRLMNDLVKQTVTKVIYASGPLMSAFESYAEKKNDLIEYITDQLNNGVYKTGIKVIETIDPITGEKKTTKVATLVPDTLSPGGYKRSETSPFSYYGIEIGQVAVSKIAYSDKVNEQIAQQQKANMQIQTAKAEAAAAQQEAIKAEEQGKARAAQAKWEQERIKATEVTKAEQEYEVAVTKARQERESSKLAAEKAEFDKKRIIAEGEAEAAANRAKVAAGLTPQEKIEWEYKTKVGVAEAISEIKLPVVIMGGQGNSGSSTMDIMSLKFATDLIDKLSK